ncbi:MAG: bifunctional hydroxymethylpyrimidine kinase/phosphomethylpyrimidine kinase [Gemmatimonadota bacterium]|nr:MAG: bifunctional hydroxymethylpyrimidine kinase/phosphomethylpyrimidine kinase [Gemmatimonadota bacterium]
MNDSLPIVLTIAGSDSGGGAGIQADLKTFQAFGVFGTSAVTAVTAQNTLGVSTVHPVPPDMVRAQIAAVADDLPPSAVKTGMLASARIVEVVADALEQHDLGPYVLDPVMVASSGHRLLATDAQAAVARRLVPLADLSTPNLAEASVLADLEIANPDDMRAAAERLIERGARAVLMKGGHLGGTDVVDILHDGSELLEWRHPRLDTPHTHGTGCTLSAAITAGLALGSPLADAVDAAIEFVSRAIAAAPGLGKGQGPLNHSVRPRIRPGT